jgi:hypothetical protein
MARQCVSPTLPIALALPDLEDYQIASWRLRVNKVLTPPVRVALAPRPTLDLAV